MAERRKPKRKQYNKDELIAVARGGKLMAFQKAQMLLTLGVLYDWFGFTAEEIEEFCDKYYELLESYNNGNEDLVAWSENIKELTGIEIEV